jgi:hypothetical protein
MDFELRARGGLEPHFRVLSSAIFQGVSLGISIWLARSSKEGLGELSKRMGNSEAVCKRHYLETLTREEGKSWFALRRSIGAP